MDNHQKSGQILGQIFIAIAFGLVGAVLSIFIAGIYDDRVGLLGIGWYGLVGFYIGHPVGIGYDGFKALKKLGRQQDFFRFFVQSIIGAVLGVIIVYYFPAELLLMVLPLAGATIGFNFGLTYTRSNDT
jgi:hypothetical protein